MLHYYLHFQFQMFFKKAVSVGFLLVLSACSTTQQTAEAPKSREDKTKLSFGSLAGPEGITLGSEKISGRTNDAGGQVVNRILWQASLDTLKFAPLISSDGAGGILVTDWYQPPNAKDRIKIQVRIKDRELRSNALEVSVYKQVKQNNQWHDAGIDMNASRELENIILLKARDIRVNTQ
jgi:hypothetical protein